MVVKRHSSSNHVPVYHLIRTRLLGGQRIADHAFDSLNQSSNAENVVILQLLAPRAVLVDFFDSQVSYIMKTHFYARVPVS
jgi:hypothetical protein